MNHSAGRLERGDWIAAVFLGAVGLALRVPFRSHFAYHWDSAQFALAIGEYNIRTSQPHAPGFYLYVMLGRLVNLLVGEPHMALVWLSVIAGAWLAAAGYLLATSMFGRRTGLGTGLILLTSPLCWFHSEVALTNIVDSALIVSFVFVCWRAIQGGVTWPQTVTLAALLAAVAGVRQQSAPLLIPMWGYVFWGFARPRMGKFVCAAVLAVGFSLFWLIPTLKSAGGVVPYLNLLHLKSQYDAPRIVWAGGGVGAILMDASCIGRACWVGLLGAAIIPLMELIHWAVFERAAIAGGFWRTNKTQLCVLGLWIAPMLLFGMFMYVAQPGQVLSFFPAVAVLASLGLVRFSERLVISQAVRTSSVLWAVVAMVGVSNVVVFIYPAPVITRLLVGLPMTGVEVREHDAKLSACFQAIRKSWPSGNIIVCHRLENLYWGFRQFQYHLPEYENVLLVADTSLPDTLGAKKWIGYERRTTFQTEIPIPDGQGVLLVVPPGQSLDAFKSYFDVRNAVLVMESGAKLYELHP